jgi:hypothetical protein
MNRTMSSITPSACIALLFIILVGVWPVQLNAQQADTLFLATDSIVLARVLEIGVEEVKYKRADNPGGPTYIMLKAELRKITYANGASDTFAEVNPVQLQAKGDLFARGGLDAKKSYHGNGKGGTFWTSFLLTPVVGLIPAISCSSTQPKEANLNYPDIGLMQVPEYSAGYKQEAFRIKRRAVWKAWGFGFVSFVPVVVGVGLHVRQHGWSW